MRFSIAVAITALASTVMAGAQTRHVCKCMNTDNTPMPNLSRDACNNMYYGRDGVFYLHDIYVITDVINGERVYDCGHVSATNNADGSTHRDAMEAHWGGACQKTHAANPSAYGGTYSNPYCYIANM